MRRERDYSQPRTVGGAEDYDERSRVIWGEKSAGPTTRRSRVRIRSRMRGVVRQVKEVVEGAQSLQKEQNAQKAAEYDMLVLAQLIGSHNFKKLVEV